MQLLRNKSEFNRNAAELLLKNGLPAPSIHCNYYSCVQKLFCIIFNGIKNEEEFNREAKELNTGSHDLAIRTIKSDLQQKRFQLDDGFRIYKNFQNWITELKTYRVNSDYKNIEITNDIGQEVNVLADKVRSIIKQVYKI